ncbi:MAG TPA: hypothetical protein ENI23_05690 [bacterium]|nr:hypothetical protein [bacterium]
MELPDLRQRAFDLTQTLKNVSSRALGASKRFGLSAPNIQARIASEQAKFAPLAQEATAQAQFAEAELGRRLGFLLADQEADNRISFEAELPLIQERFAREQTNYSEDKQRELDVLLENLKQSGTSSRAELDRINQLAIAESGYQNSLEKIRVSTDESIREAIKLKELTATPTKTPNPYLPSARVDDTTISEMGGWTNIDGVLYPTTNE